MMEVNDTTQPAMQSSLFDAIHKVYEQELLEANGEGVLSTASNLLAVDRRKG